MSTESEQMLENKLMEQLVAMGYQSVKVTNEEELIANLKVQLEAANEVSLSASEFEQVLTYISRDGTIFRHAELLRERIPYVADDGSDKTIILLNQNYWCKNQFQVTHQISMEGTFKNRYDVTILINGLPLVQVELKRRGVELKQAFNQLNRYQRATFASGKGLFLFVQLFVISNGVNTKYFANAPVGERDFKQTFFWANEKNKHIARLEEFATHFMDPCHLSKMITQYMVLNTNKQLMVLRPYQYYAVEAIVERVKKTDLNGYIWHTTGSGKTLTSFKAAQIISRNKSVHKVLFVVDRKDLDYQTVKEFNSFKKESVNGTSDTRVLVNQLADVNTTLIVTTIQKLNNAISKNRYKNQLEGLRNEKVVFIFDECHRSQFGDTHKNICNFFQKAQLFGFTGTPILAENANRNEHGLRTTKDLFDKRLHSYVITDAIRDGNVLKFAVEYIRTFKAKEEVDDIEIEAIDDAEVMNSPVRQELIARHIIQKYNVKTFNKKFNAIFCVSGVPAAISYYNIFKQLKEAGEHDLKVATIFSFEANPEDNEHEARINQVPGDITDEQMSLAADGKVAYLTKSPREHLESFMADYNAMFQQNFSTEADQYYMYYNNLSNRVKEKGIDLLIVVDMFLTGFDSKKLNTLFVDKNLRYHGLIQAYSRTNRTCGEQKSHGNIVVYRNLKDATDAAIKLFADNEPNEIIIEPPFEELADKFDEAYEKLIACVANPDAVSDLVGEESEAEFVKCFRTVSRLINRMKQYEDFSFNALGMSEQEFEDFQSKFLDIYDKTRQSQEKEKTSILDDLDFEVELLHRDEVNVDYIIQLLVKLKGATVSEREQQVKQIKDLLKSDVKLRSKRELIERFIDENLPKISDSDEVLNEFSNYIVEQRRLAMVRMSEANNLDPKKLEHVVSEYMYSAKKPLMSEVLDAMQFRPKLNERTETANMVIDQVVNYVDTYESGFGSF